MINQVLGLTLQASQTSRNNMASIASVIILAVFLYFLMIRPQRKRQKQMEDMHTGMKIGDEVLTAGGFYGIISALDDKNVVLEMLPDFHKMMIRKESIVRVIKADDVEAEEEAAETDQADEKVEKVEKPAETGSEEASKSEDAPEKADE
ncbi:preprotein translocase subunit YajC [Pseudoramibacter sp.]|jgi:preprotein translocase subunit YajC|uniref:preprotein translocase subunit YajC n=1 Tax=Pseudoramibacter sp. TaxID=2034862 RepID=UPI0025F65775|nr:preprotein translocase subunit YajC [Pseudoramibacter sp.]MCH4072605.1 preprotein translocase subunit YajC [Pseudoramibacter sp.]MCH4106376.1 preprotein translocase subunit YajC [Pseudoramibacter sp.]